VYAVLVVKPDTVIGLDAPVPVRDPGVDKTVYEVAPDTAVKATLTVVPVTYFLGNPEVQMKFLCGKLTLIRTRLHKRGMKVLKLKHIQ
jgi:hypothetical protein